MRMREDFPPSPTPGPSTRQLVYHTPATNISESREREIFGLQSLNVREPTNSVTPPFMPDNANRDRQSRPGPATRSMCARLLFPYSPTPPTRLPPRGHLHLSVFQQGEMLNFFLCKHALNPQTLPVFSSVSSAPAFAHPGNAVYASS